MNMPTILDAFYSNVLKLADRPCLHYKRDGRWRSLSWSEAAGRINGYAAGLVSLGVKRGDTVGILSNTRMEWTLADMAILSAGGIVVPVYPSLSSEQIAYILNDAGVSVLFVENAAMLAKADSIKDRLPKLRNILTLEDLSLFGRPGLSHYRTIALSNETASIIYTSGTTGRQKGVVITHENIMAEVLALKKIFDLGHDEIILSFLPLAHVLGRAVQFFQLAQGCRTAYAESVDAMPANFMEVRPHMTVAVPRFLEKIYERINAEALSGGRLKRRIFEWAVSTGGEYAKVVKKRLAVPVMMRLKHLIAWHLVFSKVHKRLGGRIKFIVSGGAPLSAGLAKFFYDMGLLVLEGYGLTETFAAVTVNRPDDFHFGTTGKPLSGVDIKLSEEDEILVKGGMVFKEYFKLPADTAHAFSGGGWFKTGDIGEFSKDGFLRITGRKKDIIVTAGGKNIAPQAVESLLEESHYIRHAVVLGDGRKYVTALLSLEMETIERYADENGISYASRGELIGSDKIKGLISSIIEKTNAKLADFEGVKKFAILETDFAIETGELTPTMKVRRKVVEEKYKDIVEGLYSGS